MVNAIKKYKPLFNCAPTDLHREAKKADRNGTIDDMVVSAVPKLVADKPTEDDLAKSGIYFSLKEFCETMDLARLGRKFGGLPEVCVYKAVYNESDELD